MDALHPGGVLSPQVVAGLQQRPVLQDVPGRDPAFRQPAPHVRPAGRGDLAPLDLPGRGVEIAEGELLPVDIQPACDGHRDLLTLPGAPQAPAREIGYTANREASELGRSPGCPPGGKANACRLKTLTGPEADAWHLMGTPHRRAVPR